MYNHDYFLAKLDGDNFYGSQWQYAVMAAERFSKGPCSSWGRRQREEIEMQHRLHLGHVGFHLQALRHVCRVVKFVWLVILQAKILLHVEELFENAKCVPHIVY